MSHPFDPNEGLIIVPTRLWGPSGDTVVRPALDTCATGSVVSWDIVVFLGYDPAIVSERIQMTTGSGVEFVPRVIIERIEGLRQERQYFPVLCHNMPPGATVRLAVRSEGSTMTEKKSAYLGFEEIKN